MFYPLYHLFLQNSTAMATIKLILRTDKENSSGECPLYLRIIKNRKINYISMGLYLRKKEWEPLSQTVKKSHKKSARLNALLLEKKAEAQATIVENEAKNRNLSSWRIKEELIGAEPVDFFVFCLKYCKALESGYQFNTLNRFQGVVKKMKKFCKDQPLFLNDITVPFLKEYEYFLRKKCNNKSNTVFKDFAMIRKILNDAIDEGLLSRDDNPFHRYRVKLQPTKRAFLLEEELKAIENLELSTRPPLLHARNIFVFACYTGGIRISDLLQLRWTDIGDGRVSVKTKKTGLMQVVKLADKALAILDYYKDTEPSGKFVFPYIFKETEIDSPLKLHNSISRNTSIINKHLSSIINLTSITKHVSFHVSRHTFATLALRKGMRIEYVSKLLGHTDLKETQIYAKIVNEDLDIAMEVFNE